MKEYRVSLEIAASREVTGCELADLLRVPRAALIEEPARRSVVWRCEPSTGQTGRLEHRISQLAEEVCPRRELPRGGGVRRVSLAIDVRYDTASCTIKLPSYSLVYFRNSLAKSIPELGSIEYRCTPSEDPLPPGEDPHEDADSTREEVKKRHEAWKAAGRPRSDRAPSPLALRQTRPGPAKAHADEYMVSLDAYTSRSVTVSEVSDVLGLPAESFTSIDAQDSEGVRWRCFVEEAKTAGLSEQLRFLTSQVRPCREFDFEGDIEWIVLDVGVIYNIRKSLTGHVRFPLSSLRSLLARRLLVHYVELNSYPWRPNDDEEET